MPLHPDWDRLGKALKTRRVEIDAGYRSRAAFAAATGLNERLVADLENARRTRYRETTLQAVERAYQWGPGSITAVLNGRPPSNLPRRADPAPDLERLPTRPPDDGPWTPGVQTWPTRRAPDQIVVYRRRWVTPAGLRREYEIEAPTTAPLSLILRELDERGE